MIYDNRDNRDNLWQMNCCHSCLCCREHLQQKSINSLTRQLVNSSTKKIYMHTTTKLRTVFAAIAMMLCISSAAQGTDIAEKIMQDTERLIGSAAFAHTMQHDGQGIYTDHFKYTLSEEEMADTAFLPDELRRLSQTLYEAVPIAPVALSHRSGGVASPVDCLGFYWPNKYETVAFSYPLPEKLNYQFVTFTGADGLRRCYGLAYHKVEFTDLA